MSSVHENDDIEIVLPIWIPSDTFAGWKGILDTASPAEGEVAAPFFTKEALAQDFIDARDPFFTVGDYAPESIHTPQTLLSYLDSCEQQGATYVVIDPEANEHVFRGRFRRITAFRNSAKKICDPGSAGD